MVKKKLSALRHDKAGGADNLLPRLLMQIQNEISHPLWILFQKSLHEGAVPEDWKRANVTPIFKKGSRGLPENYRPVSLTSQCSKLFEAIVRTKKKDGPVSGLKSAGPRGRFQFLGAAGPVSYL